MHQARTSTTHYSQVRPNSEALEVHLAEDSTVDLTVRNGKLVVAVEEPEETLEALVAQITPENRHGETQTGKSVGKKSGSGYVSERGDLVWNQALKKAALLLVPAG